MNEIDWTKPLEADGVTEVTLLRVLDTSRYQKYLVTFKLENQERAVLSDESGVAFLGTCDTSFLQLRNKQVPMVLYGRLDQLPIWRTDPEGRAWTNYKGARDTHVMTLTADDIARLVKPIRCECNTSDPNTHAPNCPAGD